MASQSVNVYFYVKTDRSIFDYQRALSFDGVYVTVGGNSVRIIQLIFFVPMLAKACKKKALVVMHKPNKDMHKILELFDSGKAKPVIDRCFPLKETANAFRHFEEGHFKGKVVIKVT
jgi:NADPH:quinone reductase-like Zn-dependent oxidoreductase